MERESLLMGKLTRIVEGRRVIAKEVDDKRTKEERQQQNSTISSRTGLDRPHKQVIGPPARSTDVHNVHKERARSTARSTD